jgi:hypothetical protein
MVDEQAIIVFLRQLDHALAAAAAATNTSDCTGSP